MYDVREFVLSLQLHRNNLDSDLLDDRNLDSVVLGNTSFMVCDGLNYPILT